MKIKSINDLVLTSILLAIVIVLQLFASVIKIGQFQFSLVLIPITIGAIIQGPKVGFLLGFAFGLIVIFTGDAAFFMSYGGLATILIVLSKGSIAGYISGLIYKLHMNKKILVFISSITTPIINTLIFIIGTSLFLYDALVDASGGSNGLVYLFTVMIGFNFLIELFITIIITPAIHRIINIYIEKKNI